jgi:ADP-heptose:LPS heptosyltransferase
MPRLHISDRRERALVTAADGIFAAAAAVARPFSRRQAPVAPRRILLLRLERIGDLLMTLPAIADVRALAPDAEIDLVVGGWNGDLARAIEPVTRVQTLDAAWLAREGTGLGMAQLLRAARRWRTERYDLAINFEPDVRSNLLLAAAGARWTAGYASGGGGALLDVALDYDTRSHTTDQARGLVASVLHGDAGVHQRATPPPSSRPLLEIPADAHARAARLVSGAAGPLVAMHVSGGRPIKQWPPERFAEVARGLIEARAATIVLTGSEGDRAIVEAVKRTLPFARVVDATGEADLLTLAALLTRTALLVTGDTGPMHLAVAVRTPVVAVFGPSDPVRYAPRGPADFVVRFDLPCAPCNRIRLPPARCTGHTPDCLASVGSDRVLAAALSVLDGSTLRGEGQPGTAVPGGGFGNPGAGSIAGESPVAARGTTPHTSRA